MTMTDHDQMTPQESASFARASANLTYNYLAPVPSQFMAMPRAMARTGPVGEAGFSVLGYVRALADDCLAMTGCIDGGRV
jgi:hypothetical protein